MPTTVLIALPDFQTLQRPCIVLSTLKIDYIKLRKLSILALKCTFFGEIRLIENPKNIWVPGWLAEALFESPWYGSNISNGTGQCNILGQRDRSSFIVPRQNLAKGQEGLGQPVKIQDKRQDGMVPDVDCLSKRTF